jgi:hypothetical protein
MPHQKPQAPERTSAAPPLPGSDAQVPGIPGADTVTTERIHTKVLQARSTALPVTILNKNAREADGGHQAVLAERAVPVVVYMWSRRRGCCGSSGMHVLGPVPGVGVMAKRSQGLLNVGTLSRGLLAVSGVICGSSAGAGAFFFSRLQGALGGPGPVWVQLGPPLPPLPARALFREAPFKIK